MATDSKIRIYLRYIETFDFAHSESNVREIEMMVDAICWLANLDHYTMQFFEDCRVYGLKEAVVYLVNQLEKKRLTPEATVKLGELQQKCTEVIEKVAATRNNVMAFRR